MFPYLIKIKVRKLLMDKKIDFVLTWVDGNDPEWQSVYNQYAEVGASDKNIIRFRDWNNLKYWFRGVEKFAPWVNIVHFVTCGHYPEWLNLQCNKLNLVKHTDYIPNKWLPTFNSNVIELNLHRINGLAENFVLFNDDMFLINDVSDDFFFKNGMPCDMGVLNVIDHFKIGHIILNDLVLINKYFKKNSVLKKNYSKWFNIKYGKYLVRTMSLMHGSISLVLRILMCLVLFLNLLFVIYGTLNQNYFLKPHLISLEKVLMLVSIFLGIGSCVKVLFLL